jgi:hypothetical protein
MGAPDGGSRGVAATDPAGSSLIADEPIGDPLADRLERTAFADRAARVVAQVRAESETAVMGVIGPWGSGKTSVMNLIAAEVQSGSADWKVVRFNPWLVSDLESLVRTFFDALADAMPSQSGARDKLRRYAAALAPWSKALAFIPGAPAGAADVAQTALARLGGEKPLRAMHDELSEVLAELDVPLLVLVDDLDRLHPDELTLVFKLVRLAGRLPRVYYLLAFDEQTLLDVLASTELGRGSSARALAYLEKIVQVRLDLPPLHERQARELMDACWRRVITAGGLDPEALLADRRYGAFADRWQELGLDEPRRIKRLFAQVDAVLPLVIGEVDPTDLLVATYFRTFAPDVYRELRAHKGALVWPPRTDPEEFDAPVAQGSPPLRSALATLFAPRVARPGHVPPWHELAWGKHIASADYFDRYFRLGIPSGDVADAAVVKALKGDPEAAEAVVAAARVDPGRVLRKLRVEGVTLEVEGREHGLSLGARLWTELGLHWERPARPFAHWAGNFLRVPRVAEVLTRGKAEELIEAGALEYALELAATMVPDPFAEEPNWELREGLGWPAEFNAALVEAGRTVVEAAAERFGEVGTEALPAIIFDATLAPAVDGFRLFVPMAKLADPAQVKPWLAEHLVGQAGIVAVAALFAVKHDDWRPEQIRLDLEAPWPLEQLMPLAEVAQRLRDVVERDRIRDKRSNTNLGLSVRMRLAEDALARELYMP